MCAGIKITARVTTIPTVGRPPCPKWLFSLLFAADVGECTSTSDQGVLASFPRVMGGDTKVSNLHRGDVVGSAPV